MLKISYKFEPDNNLLREINIGRYADNIKEDANGVHCQILFDLGASTYFMSKSFHLGNKK